MKMKEKNGFWYALEAFDTYKYRAKFVVEDKQGKQLINTDVYTTNESRRDVLGVLINSVSKKYNLEDLGSTTIVHWSSKEQDDRTNEFIDEWLLKED